MTAERLKLHEKAETRINAIIDTLSQDKGGLADKLKQEDVKDFLVSLWVDCSTEATKELKKENAELKKLKRECETSLCRAEYQYNYEQLTKAKELLERLLITSCNSDVLNLLPNCSKVLRVRVEAEQFLSEVEK